MPRAIKPGDVGHSWYDFARARLVYDVALYHGERQRGYYRTGSQPRHVGGVLLPGGTNRSGDVFASLSIGFDKPLRIGDFVVFNDVAGTIEHIGFESHSHP